MRLEKVILLPFSISVCHGYHVYVDQHIHMYSSNAPGSERSKSNIPLRPFYGKRNERSDVPDLSLKAQDIPSVKNRLLCVPDMRGDRENGDKEESIHIACELRVQRRDTGGLPLRQHTQRAP